MGSIGSENRTRPADFLLVYFEARVEVDGCCALFYDLDDGGSVGLYSSGVGSWRGEIETTGVH